MLFSLCFCAVK